MEISPEQFDSWGRHCQALYAAQLINAARKSESLVDSIYLVFENVIKLPSEADLSDFFYMIPNLPPQISPPAFMRDQNMLITCRKEPMRGSYDTDLLYDSFGQYLMVSFSFEPMGDFLEVKLKLTTHWTDAMHIDSALEQLDAMKTNLNAAFHSIIKDKARMLLE